MQPLDLTINASLKKMEKRDLGESFSSSIMKALKEDLTREVTTINNIPSWSLYMSVSWKRRTNFLNL